MWKLFNEPWIAGIFNCSYVACLFYNYFHTAHVSSRQSSAVSRWFARKIYQAEAGPPVVFIGQCQVQWTRDLTNYIGAMNDCVGESEQIDTLFMQHHWLVTNAVLMGKMVMKLSLEFIVIRLACSWKWKKKLKRSILSCTNLFAVFIYFAMSFMASSY